MAETATGGSSARATGSIASSVSARRLQRAQRRSLLRSPKPCSDGETVEAEYEGEHNAAGLPDGRGKIKFASGELYEGEFLDGKIHGRGSLRFTTGDVYTGLFKADMMDGHGTYYLSDGEAMVGCCKADAPTGEGAMWSADRQKAWRLVDGQPVEEISLSAAALIAERVGEAVPA